MHNVRQNILQTLAKRGPLEIEEIAQTTHLSKMAARYHVRLLERNGLVKRGKPDHRGTVGRPSAPYTLGANAHELLPKRYDALASLLLDELVRALGAEKARELAQRAGKRVARTAPRLTRLAGIESRLERLAAFLFPRGYRLSWESTDQGAQVVVHDCPYYRVARSQPLVCDLDRALFGAFLGVPLAKLTWATMHGSECRLLIEN